MALQAEQVVILTESNKFNQNGAVPLKLSDRIKTVITDTGIPNEVRQDLEEHGVSILTIQE